MKQQRGIAIVTVMLMVSLATIAVTGMMAQQRLEVRRSATLFAIAQRNSIAEAGEQFAFSILSKDKTQGQYVNTDSPDDDWNTPIPELPVVSGGTISGCLHDLSGRLNVNNLLTPEGQINQVYKERFENLFSSLNIDTNWVNALIDWIDKNQEVSGGAGAESDFYIGLDPPYRAADQEMLSVTEIAMVRGFHEDRELYEKLLPHVTALPRGSKLNVNMATPEVILSLAGFMDKVKSRVDPWQQDQNWSHYPDCDTDALGSGSTTTTTGNDYQGPFEKVADFVSQASSKDEKNKELKLDGADTADLDVLSHYFMLKIHTKLGDTGIEQFSILQRDDKGKVKVIWRSQHTL